MKSLYLLLFVSVSISAKPQITAKVFDEDDGKPIPFAAVELVGKQKGTFTDSSGSFMLNDTAGKITIRAIGYAPYRINSKEKKSDKFFLTNAMVPPALEKGHTFSGQIKTKGIEGRSNATIKAEKGYQYVVFIPECGHLQEVKFEFLKKGFYRLRVYSKDHSNNMPGDDLLTKNIISDKEQLSLDLITPADGFYIGIEFLSDDLELKANQQKDDLTFVKSLGSNWGYNPSVQEMKKIVFNNPLIQVKIRE